MVVTRMQRQRRCETSYRAWERLPEKLLYINPIAHGPHSPLHPPWQSLNAQASASWKRFIWTSSWRPACRPHRSCWTCSIHQGRRGYANSMMHFDDKLTRLTKFMSLITQFRLDMVKWTRSLCTLFARSIVVLGMNGGLVKTKRVSLQCPSFGTHTPVPKHHLTCFADSSTLPLPRFNSHLHLWLLASAALVSLSNGCRVCVLWSWIDVAHSHRPTMMRWQRASLGKRVFSTHLWCLC